MWYIDVILGGVFYGCAYGVVLGLSTNRRGVCGGGRVGWCVWYARGGDRICTMGTLGCDSIKEFTKIANDNDYI